MLFFLFTLIAVFCFFVVGYYTACKDYNRGVNHPTRRIVAWSVAGFLHIVLMFFLYYGNVVDILFKKFF